MLLRSLSDMRAPLDIFLQRAHALPLPYLNYSSFSFLVYLSPRAYLSMLRQQQQAAIVEGPELPLNASFCQIRDFLSSYPRGATMVTLQLMSHSGLQLFPASISMPSLTTRPTFPLCSRGAELEHVLMEAPVDAPASISSSQQYNWVLDFTLGGRLPGIVLSQSRMRDIEMILNPLGGMDNLPPVGMLSFQLGSWVSLLVGCL